METISSKSVSNCRICMKWRTSKMQPLFIEKNVALLEKILYCTGLQLKELDGLPSNICNACVKNLTTSYKFKSTCLRSNEIFHNLPLNRVKIENFDNETNVNGEIFNEEKLDEEILDEEILDEDIFNEENFAEIKTVVKVDDDHDDNINESFGNNQEIKEELLERLETEPKDIKEEYSSDYISEEELPPELPKVKKNRNDKRKCGSRPIIINGVKVYVCDECGLTFESGMERYLHKRKHTTGRNGTFICEICGTIFNDKYKFGDHIKSHVPPTLKCPKCDYKAGRDRDLQKHIRTHNDVKQYLCQYCSHSVHSAWNLTAHIKRVHQRVKRYKCEQCNKGFYDKTKFNNHMDTHNNVKRFHCEHCNSYYTRRCHLKKHLEKHHGIILPKQRSGRQRMYAKMERLIVNNDNNNSYLKIFSVREKS